MDEAMQAAVKYADETMHALAYALLVKGCNETRVVVRKCMTEDTECMSVSHL